MMQLRLVRALRDWRWAATVLLWLPCVPMLGCRTAGTGADHSAQQFAFSDSVEINGSERADSQQLTLRPGLLIDITVMVAGEPEVTVENKRLSEEGKINLPLLGLVRLGNLTRAEAGARLALLYDDYYVDPSVLVQYAEMESRGTISPWGYVTVMGRVKQPGRLAIPPSQDLTASKAILASGGFVTSARDRAVRINRRGANGEQERIVVNMRAFFSGRGEEEDLLLLPGDVVYVPETIF